MALPIEHDGASTQNDLSSRVAPDATGRWDVCIGPGASSAAPARNRAET
jgi:hypothetical protein